MDPEDTETEEETEAMSLQEHQEDSKSGHDPDCPCQHWVDCYIKSASTSVLNLSSTPSGSATDQEPMEQEESKGLKGNLSPEILQRYWSLQVPPLLSPHADCDCLNIVYEEARIQSRLFDPLEHFIALSLATSASSPSSSCSSVAMNLDNVREFLTSKVTSSVEPLASGHEAGTLLCGRMFKPGEATYCCRDCSTDPTCVLCVDCFKASIHRGHKYRMSMSGGGGYCDCGDPEAWKGEDYGCANHIAKRSQESSSQSSSGSNKTGSGDDGSVGHFVSDIESRLESVTRALVRYCHLVLTWESGMNLPGQLEPDGRSRQLAAHPEEEDDEEESSASGSSKEAFAMNLSILKKPKTNVSKVAGRGSRSEAPEAQSLPQIYATMLFNDEIHTYEQVIATLGRAIECSQKEAIDFATTIDREGRSIVKCSASFQTCSSVKTTIERITSRNQGKPLRTEVMLTSVIAHQTFAGRCLSWIQDRLLPSCPSLFRRVFGRIMSEPFDATQLGRRNAPPSFLEQVMRSDVKLWKTARNQWHQLFVMGLLMDPNSKRYFARTFTRLYPTLSKDFVSDDHDVHVSIMSLTVQIYTVPSLGLDLMTESSPGCPGALHILLKTFIDECAKFLNPATEKLQFERVVTTIQAFRRAQYILVDLKYLLANCKPRGMEGSNFPPLDTPDPNDKLGWTPLLRSSFVHGFGTLISLLDWMQGMDAVTRQVGTHVEFESEWENGINLQLKLTPVISLLIEWASSDQTVLLKCLHICLDQLAKTWTSDESGTHPVLGNMTSRRLLGTSVDDVIEYDVSSRSVSVHAPLSRVTVALLVQLSSRCGIDYNSHGLLARKKPSLIQLMELSLRTLVLTAQFRAGMWRRNGYSLVNQVYFYHNSRLREEMFDRDILALQYVASILNANEFLVHVISKFGLFLVIASSEPSDRIREASLLARDADDFTRQTITILEELLTLLLTLVSERWSPGLGANVSAEDRIKKEIIQCLAIEPMTHSELLKVLPKDATHWPNIEAVIESVALFKRPTHSSDQQGSATSGRYEVKEELIDDWFNPYFYHYSREQSSKAEAAQLKRKKVVQSKSPDGIYLCCPPPLPPLFSDAFAKVLDLVTCDITLHVVHGVLKRAVSPQSHSIIFSEVQFEKVLHLISLGLREEERFARNIIQSGECPSQDMDQEAACGVDFSRKCVSKGIFDLLKQAQSAKNSEVVNSCVKLITSEHVLELLRWTIDKFNQVLTLRGAGQECSAGGSTAEGAVAGTSGQSSSSPAGKSLSASEAAAKRRERIMAQMRSQQKSFMSHHPTYFKEEVSKVAASVEDDDIEEKEVEAEPIAIGPNQRGRKVYEKEVHTCILCREEQEVSAHSMRSLVLCALVQRSTVLSKNRSNVPPTAAPASPTSSAPNPTSPMTESSVPMSGTQGSGSSSSNDPSSAAAHQQSTSVEALFMPSDLNIGAHVSTCGHVMHADCWQKFFESVLAKERRRPLRYGRHVSFDVDKAEYLCPLCECLSNTVIPILPPPSALMISSSKRFIQEEMSMSDWIKSLFASVDQSQPIWVKDPSMNIETGEKYICRLKSTPMSKLTGSEYSLQSQVLESFTKNVKIYEEVDVEKEGRSPHFCILSKTIMEMMKLFSQSIYTVGLNLHQNPDDDRVPVLSFWSTAFSIHAIERVLREEAENVGIFADVTSRKFNCLQALVRYVAASSGLFNVAVIRTHAVKLLKYLLVPPVHATSPTCILDIDPFGLLVSLVLASPSLYVHSEWDEPGSLLTPPLGSVFDRHFLNLIFVLHLVQVILSRAVSQMEMNKNRDEMHPEQGVEAMEVDGGASGSKHGSKFLSNFAAEVIQAAGLASKDSSLIGSDPNLVTDIKTALVPFMRCSGLFFHFLTSVAPPNQLKRTTQSSSEGGGEVEFDVLARYLGLDPKFHVLIQSTDLRNLALNWARNPRVNAILKTSTTATMVTETSPTSKMQPDANHHLMTLIRQPHTVNQLIELPSDYSDLINSVSNFSCPNSRESSLVCVTDGSDARSPTLCLICGSMLCSQSYCCQSELEGAMVGACTLHSHFCGAGTGLFLRIRDCKILLLAGRSKGCYLSPPFIDEFGETDQGLVRGNPLHLCQRAYRDLHRLWLRHGIPEQVAHALEVSTNLAATNWPLL